jgi:hypothetical protein
MFGPMKEALRGRRFSSDKEIISAVQSSLNTQTKTFSDGITKFMKRWNWRVEVGGTTLKNNINFVSVYLQ